MPSPEQQSSPASSPESLSRPDSYLSLKAEYGELSALFGEFDSAFAKAVESGQPEDLAEAKRLQAELEKGRDAIREKLWPPEFEMKKEQFREQISDCLSLLKENGLLEEMEKKGFPAPDIGKMEVAVKADRERFAEKMATMNNPRFLLVPFALSLGDMAKAYGEQIERHFVEDRVEGDRRLPDPKKTKLFGADGAPLELRTDKENVNYWGGLDNLSYFPEWKKDAAGKITAEGGKTKEQVVAEQGGWRLILVDDTPLAPEKGEGAKYTKTAEIKTKGGRTKKVARTPIEGGMDAADQYKKITGKEEGELNEDPLTPEDWVIQSMLRLKKHNQVLDDDRGTAYWCRLLGAVTTDGSIPGVYWYRGGGRARMGGDNPRDPGSCIVVRSGARVIVKFLRFEL